MSGSETLSWFMYTGPGLLGDVDCGGSAWFGTWYRAGDDQGEALQMVVLPLHRPGCGQMLSEASLEVT